jgi:hypothetical protein
LPSRFAGYFESPSEYPPDEGLFYISDIIFREKCSGQKKIEFFSGMKLENAASCKCLQDRKRTV